ncbi:MAG: hypothetical protein ABRQ25_14045 [Clostridiaceae bacterium]
MKGYLITSLLLSVISFISMLYISLERSQQHILRLKPLIYADSLAAVLFAVMIFYILLRKERLGFRFAYVIMAVLILLYASSMALTGEKIIVDRNLGYVLLMTDDFSYRVFFIFAMAAIAWSIILLSGYRHALKIPLAALFIISLGIICENILYLAGMELFPYPVTGEFLLIVLMDYSLKIRK